ncbi:von Willebrand factor C domain-containing protein 2-like [Pelmatolapia mariae]|uniref:von Willebrand factor C domain-containing protein 2-like n=1 Tax=Pelmatolapia mariae TaxID=158779 RepID=UPI002FE57912
MANRYLSVLLVLILLLLPLPHGPACVAVAAEYSKTDLDYEFGDYRGKWCIDDHGFVYSIGEVYYPSPTSCPCTCTIDGPVCVRPKCPRIHPRCTRIRYKACCPVCEAMARVCVYGGKTYRLLEEFRMRPHLQSRFQTPRWLHHHHLILHLLPLIKQHLPLSSPGRAVLPTAVPPVMMGAAATACLLHPQTSHLQ